MIYPANGTALLNAKDPSQFYPEWKILIFEYLQKNVHDEINLNRLLSTLTECYCLLSVVFGTTSDF